MKPERCSLELLLLSTLNSAKPTSLNSAVQRLAQRYPECEARLCAGAQPPTLAGPDAQKAWAALHREGWGRLYRTAGLILTPAGEARLIEHWPEEENP